MVATSISTTPSFCTPSRRQRTPSISFFPHSNSARSFVSALPGRRSDSSLTGLSLRTNEKGFHDINQSYRKIEAKSENPPIMPAVTSPGGPLDLSSILFRNRVIFIGEPVSSQVAHRVISQLVTLATIDDKADILIYLNCPGGSIHAVLAIYDCMSWIKPRVGTVCFGMTASLGALLLAGGEKGMRYSMPNSRIMIHQPRAGAGGHVEDVRSQVNDLVQSRNKVDLMFSTFTGRSVESVREYTNRDIFLSPSEAMDFGFIDGILETEF
ncbi:hypothetical protein Tsubulata_007064 [Turnera subulata]|uniref:ATP-dependent Clp protease proteolytic subunit n=1 Tax=Turnera subulata TaxID=218843 RepID=A0A9Q0GIC0_9ROSI|nr:hypothetical protein Tsubulata_007064 [Turnera subulata]